MTKKTMDKGNSKKSMFYKNGFTLIELVTVMIIIGILTSIALPTYNRLKEKSRRSEAYTTLRAILDAQRRRAEGEKDDYDGSSTFAGLDINVIEGKYFTFVNKAGDKKPHSEPGENIAQAIRKDGAYAVWINERAQFAYGFEYLTMPPVEINYPPVE